VVSGGVNLIQICMYNFVNMMDVDGLILKLSNLPLMHELKNDSKKISEMADLGLLHYFLDL
jgi:hypothetical protein